MLQPNPTIRPDGSTTPATATITELRLTDLGHFVEVVVPTGEHAPAVDYGSDGTFLSFKTGPILLRF